MTNPVGASEPRSAVSALKFHTTRGLGKAVSGLSRTAVRRSTRRLAPDRFTVLTVNWNTTEYLRTVVEAVQRFSPVGTEIVVIDNGSCDDARVFLRTAPVRSLRLPLNLGHGPAMDLA